MNYDVCFSFHLCIYVHVIMPCILLQGDDDVALEQNMADKHSAIASNLTVRYDIIH